MDHLDFGTELSNSRPFDYAVEATAIEVDRLVGRLVAWLLRRENPWPHSWRQRYRLSIAVRQLTLNLLASRYGDPTRYIAIGMGANQYRGDFTYRHWRFAVEGLSGVGLMELHPGYRDRARRIGRRTRVRATGQLAALARNFGVRPSMLWRSGRDDVVELRHPEGHRSHLKRWPNDADSRTLLRRMRADLATINEWLHPCFMGLHIPDKALSELNTRLGAGRHPRWVDFLDRRLYRVFNVEPNRGGRFYGGWWEYVPSAYRRFIHLAAPGRAPIWTVELDFKSMQPRLLYARVGVEPPEDCYALPGIPPTVEARSYVKHALLVLLNAETRVAARRGLQSFLLDEFPMRPDVEPGIGGVAARIPYGCPDINGLFEKLERYHEPIAGFFSTGIGQELACTESKIADRVLQQMMFGQGCPVLPIHDSFVVPKGAQDLLWQVMAVAFRDIAGFDGRLTADETELDSFRVRSGDDVGRLDLDTLLQVIQSEDKNQYGVYWSLRNDWEENKDG